MQDYKSVCAAAMICSTLADIQIDNDNYNSDLVYAKIQDKIIQ